MRRRLSAGSPRVGARPGGAGDPPLAGLGRPCPRCRRAGRPRLPHTRRRRPPGALNLYCDHPGPLSDDQYADAPDRGRSPPSSWWRCRPCRARPPRPPAGAGGTFSTSCTKPRAWSRPSSMSASARPSSGAGLRLRQMTGPSPRGPSTWAAVGCASTTEAARKTPTCAAGPSRPPIRCRGSVA